MNKSTKSIDRAFAVISSIGSVIKDAPEPTPELIKIQDRVNKMMQVYNIKVGKENYWKISKQINNIWGELAKQQKNIILDTSMNVLAETLCNLIHENTFEKLLACKQPSISEGGISKEDFKKISHSVLQLNDRFNSCFKTKSVIYTLSKPKVVKPKKKRVKIKSKAQIKHEAEQLEILKQKERKQANILIIREMVKKAKEKQ